MSNDLERLAKEYVDSKHFAEAANKRVDELKKMLRQQLVANGVADDRGNLWCPAGDYQLKHERRASQLFDTYAAEAWARENGHWENVSETVVIERLNQDALIALGWDNSELYETIASFYKESVTWAFKVIEQKSYDDE